MALGPLALVWQPGDREVFDLVLDEDGLQTDAGLETPVVVSLFTDRRVDEAEAATVPGDDRRGWWADAPSLRADGEAPLGSRLWILRGKPVTNALLQRCEAYAREALQWMIADGIVASVDLRAVRLSTWVLGLEVVLYRPGGELEPAYRRLWDVTTQRLT